MKKQRGAVLIIYMLGVMMGGMLGWGFATQHTDGKRVTAEQAKQIK